MVETADQNNRAVPGGRGVWRWGGTLAVVVAVLIAGAQLAHADEIKLGGFWISDIGVQGIEDGQMVYYNRVGTEFRRPLENVQGLRLSTYPQLGKAHEAIAKGNDRAALMELLGARQKASNKWLRHWVSHLLVGVYDRLNMPSDALDIYLLLVIEGAPRFYLEHPPLESLQNSPSEIKSALRERILMTMDLVDPSGRESVRLLLEAIDSGSVATLGQLALDRSGSPQLATITNPADASLPDGTATNGLSQARLTLPVELDIGDTVTALLIGGQYEQALARAEKIMSNDRHHLPMRLYQRGVAQMALAQAAEDDKKYLDAGLSFMSVVAYFPTSGFVGPSLVEAGFVHSRIGRSDTAARLYEKAATVIDAQEDPRYADRLQQLANGLDPAEGRPE